MILEKLDIENSRINRCLMLLQIGIFARGHGKEEKNAAEM